METTTPPKGRGQAPNESLVAWLLACPLKGYFVSVASESTDTIHATPGSFDLPARDSLGES
jgi:hypothetical protein